MEIPEADRFLGEGPPLARRLRALQFHKRPPVVQTGRKILRLVRLARPVHGPADQAAVRQQRRICDRRRPAHGHHRWVFIVEGGQQHRRLRCGERE